MKRRTRGYSPIYRRLNNTGRLTRRNSRRMRYRSTIFFSRCRKKAVEKLTRQIPTKKGEKREGHSGGGSIEQLSDIELSFWRRLNRPRSSPRCAAMDAEEFLGINYEERPQMTSRFNPVRYRRQERKKRKRADHATACIHAFTEDTTRDGK